MPLDPPAGPPGAPAGVLAAVLTPFGDDLEPDAGRLLAHGRRLLSEGGCDGLLLFGTTGEGTSLSVGERRRLLDAVVEGGIAPSRLLVGTGGCAMPDVVEMTRAAARAGCGALMLPPFYYKEVTDEGLHRFAAEVIERVGDDRLRLYLYHMPPVAGVGWSSELVGRLRREHPEVVVGLKDSSGEWETTRRFLEDHPGLAVFCGSEALLLPTLRHGGAGTITARANVEVATIRRLLERWRQPDAEALQDEVTALRDALKPYPAVPALKEILAQGTGDAGWRNVRPPLEQLAAPAAERLGRSLEQLGFAWPAALPG